jgi:hypothetical protein
VALLNARELSTKVLVFSIVHSCCERKLSQFPPVAYENLIALSSLNAGITTSTWPWFDLHQVSSICLVLRLIKLTAVCFLRALSSAWARALVCFLTSSAWWIWKLVRWQLNTILLQSFLCLYEGFAR